MHGIRLTVVAVALSLAHAPALAQTTLTVTGTPVAGGVNMGASNEYDITITNTGTEAATGVQVDAAFPPELEIGSVPACAAPRTQVPCTLAAPIAAGAEVTVRVLANAVIPDPAPTTCPGPTPIGDTTISVSAANAAEASATIANVLNPYADLQVSISGPGGVSPVTSYAITATVTNAGPCEILEVDGDAAYVDFGLPESFTATAVPAACGELQAFIDEGNFGTCFIGDMAVGATATFEFTGVSPQVVGDDLKRATYYSFAEAYTDVMQEGAPADNVAELASVYESDGGGCASTGGGVTLLSVLPLLAARAWRRRKSV